MNKIKYSAFRRWWWGHLGKWNSPTLHLWWHMKSPATLSESRQKWWPAVPCCAALCCSQDPSFAAFPTFCESQQYLLGCIRGFLPPRIADNQMRWHIWSHCEILNTHTQGEVFIQECCRHVLQRIPVFDVGSRCEKYYLPRFWTSSQHSFLYFLMWPGLPSCPH